MKRQWRAFQNAVVVSGMAVCGSLPAHALAPADVAGWDIVVEPHAPPAVRYAAEEFQQFFAQAAGHTLPITNTAPEPAGHVFIGSSAALAAHPAAVASDDLAGEDLRIRIGADAIAVLGGSPRGTLYGVYTFLENHLGVRFLAPDHTHVPKVGDLPGKGSMPEGLVTFRPPLAFRQCDYGVNRRNPVFATRLRLNAITEDPRLGGRSSWHIINHSVCRYVPLRTYGADHPEYFALVNGVRRSTGENNHSGPSATQPCMTNPDVLRLIKEGVLKKLAKEPDRRVVSVSQNDNAMYCRCEACRAIDEREGSPMGSLLTLVNAVADELAVSHPGVFVGTLAYWYSRKPPATLKPRPNVAIQLCSIENCQMHAIDDPDCPLNTGFCRDLDGWSRITEQIHIWNYDINFLDFTLPCPNLRVIAPNIRFFVARQAKSLFMEADPGLHRTDLADLRNYLMGQLMWDPEQDAQAVTDEFLRLHYGKAAGTIRAYIELIHDHALQSGKHHNCFARAADYGYDAEVTEKALALFDKAMAEAEDETVRTRVERESICAYRLAIEPLIRFVKPKPWSLPKSEDPVPEALDAATRPYLRRYMALCDKYGIERRSVSEPKTMAGLNALLRKRLGLAENELW